MLILHAKNIKKYYADRCMLAFDDLKIYSGQKIGVVGLNGAGKTTLLDILSGELVPDEGQVNTYASLAYIRQFELNDNQKTINKKIAHEFCTSGQNYHYLSGGEKTRFKIAEELSVKSDILFADEPTTNIDISGIKVIEEKFIAYPGTLLLISHDRELLDNICSLIVEVENGNIKTYKGNYSEYKRQKEMVFARHEFEYNEYINEKTRLEQSLIERHSRAKSIKKAPRRMGNSEARLHKRESNEAQEKLHNSAKSIETRLEKLKKVEKPKDIETVKIDFKSGCFPTSKILIKGTDVALKFGSKILFENSNFEILNRKRTALIGDNGTGKTSLVKMILDQKDGIIISNGTEIGYFSQELDTLNPEKTILENVMKSSQETESAVRTILARLLFKREDVFKKCGILSGGEKVKISFAKILVSGANLLILDEPTNYLDVNSIEALSSVLSEYQGALLFISHDRKFINSVAERIILIEDKKLKTFDGNLEQYYAFTDTVSIKSAVPDDNEKMEIEQRITAIIGKLCSIDPAREEYSMLDAEFKRLIERKKRLLENK